MYILQTKGARKEKTAGQLTHNNHTRKWLKSLISNLRVDHLKFCEKTGVEYTNRTALQAVKQLLKKSSPAENLERKDSHAVKFFTSLRSTPYAT